MKQFCVILRETGGMARAEIQTLTGSKNELFFDNILIFGTERENLHKRLGLSRAVYQYIFDCTIDLIDEKIKQTDWNSMCQGSYRVKVSTNSQSTERKIADQIYPTLESPKVDLKNPQTSFEFFLFEDKVIAGKLIGTVDQKAFRARRPHLRPAPHPSGMHPRIARALVNISGAKDTLVDPFCGAGGILIEAGLVGLKVKGSDIDLEMIERAKKNLDHYGVTADLKVADATELSEPVDYLVTDLPYGLNTKSGELDVLCADFLGVLKKILRKKAVVVFPTFVDYKKMIGNAGLTIEQEFRQYSHKSLSRAFVVLNAFSH